MDRRDIYGDLGTPQRRREPPEVSTVTQHVLRGTLDARVHADAAYTMPEVTLRLQLGPVFIVTRGVEAARSLRDLHRQLGPVLDALFPDLTTELERQMARRAQLNGGDSAAARLARLEGGEAI
jgi:hypothetical protein